MTMGLACDRDGYDLRLAQCSQCFSRGCLNKDRCMTESELVEMLEALPLHMPIPNRLHGASINEDGDAI